MRCESRGTRRSQTLASLYIVSKVGKKPLSPRGSILIFWGRLKERGETCLIPRRDFRSGGQLSLVLLETVKKKSMNLTGNKKRVAKPLILNGGLVKGMLLLLGILLICEKEGDLLREERYKPKNGTSTVINDNISTTEEKREKTRSKKTHHSREPVSRPGGEKPEMSIGQPRATFS